VSASFLRLLFCEIHLSDPDIGGTVATGVDPASTMHANGQIHFQSYGLGNHDCFSWLSTSRCSFSIGRSAMSRFVYFEVLVRVALAVALFLWCVSASALLAAVAITGVALYAMSWVIGPGRNADCSPI